MASTAHSDPEMMREHFETPADFNRKIEKLVKAIRRSKHFVIFTGAGISTDAGIPDFRGPEGVWTLKAQGRQRTGKRTDTLCAIPTATHMSIVQLQKLGICKYLISQNCDGLHRRSGIEPTKISELHGNGNIEHCETCGFEYLRDFHCYRLKPGRDHFTGRYCVVPNCGGRLLNSTIDFGQSLPVRPLELAEQNSKMSDLHLVLGSSLTVRPACNMPKATAKKGGKLFICNLQRTPLDSYATEHIFQKCDVIMKEVMQRLGHTIPPFLLTRHFSFQQQKTESTWEIKVAGIAFGTDGSPIPASTLKKVEIKLPDEFRPACNHSLEAEPFAIKAKAKSRASSSSPRALIRLHFMGHYSEPSFDVNLHANTASPLHLTMNYDPTTREWTRNEREERNRNSKDKENVSEEEEEEEEGTSEDMEIAPHAEASSSSEPPSMEVIGKRLATTNDDLANRFWASSVLSADASGSPVIVTCGGCRTDKPIAYLDLKTLTWKQREPKSDDARDTPFVSKARWGHSATVLDSDPSQIYLVAGWDGSCQYNDVHVYNCRTETIRAVNASGPKPSHRAGHTATAVGKELLIFGGAFCDGGPYRFFNDVYLFNTETSTWRKLKCSGEVPSPRAQHTATRIGNHIVVIGGFTGSEVTNDVHVLDMRSNVWTKVQARGTPPPVKSDISMPNFRVYPARHSIVPCKIDDAVHLVYYGPMGMFSLNPRTWTWSNLHRDTAAPLPDSMSCHSCVYLPSSSNVVILGGKEKDDKTSATNGSVVVFKVQLAE